MDPIRFSRVCPRCNCELSYKTQTAYNRAIKRNDKCRSCGLSKEISTEEILERYKNGESDRQIAKALNVCNHTIAKIRKQKGLEPNFPPKKRIECTDEGRIKCSICSEIKSINQYRVGRKNGKSSYKFSYCDECRLYKTNLRLQTSGDEYYVGTRYTIVKNRAANRSHIGFDISKEDFISIWKEQEGKCFYTGVEMSLKPGKGVVPTQMSVDRMDNTLGYIKGNIVFCTYRINSIKKDLTLDELEEYIPKWYEKIKNKMKSHDCWTRN